MPLDISFIRKYPELVKESEIKRFRNSQIVDDILNLDQRWRSTTGLIDLVRKEKNLYQQEIAKLYKSKQADLATELKEKNLLLDKNILELEQNKKLLFEQINQLVSKLGNIVAPDVVVSNNEDLDNKVIRTWMDPVLLNPDKLKLNHHVLLEKIGGVDYERGTKISGHKAYFLKDIGVLLNQALVNYSLAWLKKKSYTILQPPYFMNKNVMSGVAQLSEFDESLYHVTGGDQESYLIATSEQPICGYHSGEWLKESELPIKYCGYSPCFRKEAGSHGKDVWGIFRVHQFDKIEQFVITEDNLETSDKFQLEMLGVAEEFYQSLEIPYRVISIVSGELNNAAIRKYDLEGWFPGYNSYRELVSCSNCTDYQSRAMDIRCGIRTDKNDAKRYVHMLNSTLCACTRVICCLLELNQTETGIKVPLALQPYLAGQNFIPFVK